MGGGRFKFGFLAPFRVRITWWILFPGVSEPALSSVAPPRGGDHRPRVPPATVTGGVTHPGLFRPARRFYQKFGYQEETLIPGYYDGRQSAYQMKLRLRDA